VRKLADVLINRSKFPGQIAAFGDYKPWSWHKMEGGDSSNYPEHSGRILDLKEAKPAAVAYFLERIGPELAAKIAIAVVPSHDPAKLAGGLGMLAAELARAGNRTDASPCLVRTTKIDKLAHGGDRSVDVHLRSIVVMHPELVKGRDVLLLDDVMRTGNSLIACRKLLLDSGARFVECAAIGKTG
jgi:hypothetical protein